MTEQAQKIEMQPAEPAESIDPEWEGLAADAAGLDLTPEQSAEQQDKAAAEKERKKEIEAAKLAGAKTAAAGTVGTLAMLVSMVWPVVQFDMETQEEGVEVLAPLFKKYGVTTPGGGYWEPEIKAAVFFGGLAFTAYNKIQQEKNKEKEAANSGEQSQHGVA